MDTKATTMQFRLTMGEKQRIETSAKAADMTVSEYIRCTALSDGRVILLQDGGKIAAGIMKLATDFHDFAVNKPLDNRYALQILQGIEDLLLAIASLTEQIETVNGGEDNGDIALD